MFGVINQSRLVNGWTTRTAADLDPTIRTWHKLFRYYDIPTDDAEILDALYLRSIDTRQTFLQNGKEPPMMNAELLAAGWTGANGLKRELEEKRIAEKRFLPETAASNCPRCLGTNWETVHDQNTGNRLGVKPNCDHRPLKEGEYLFKKDQERREKAEAF